MRLTDAEVTAATTQASNDPGMGQSASMNRLVDSITRLGRAQKHAGQPVDHTDIARRTFRGQLPEEVGDLPSFDPEKPSVRERQQAKFDEHVAFVIRTLEQDGLINAC